jgi:hypothetical protein
MDDPVTRGERAVAVIHPSPAEGISSLPSRVRLTAPYNVISPSPACPGKVDISMTLLRHIRDGSTTQVWHR